MGRPASRVVDGLISHLNNLERTRKKMEKLLGASYIVRHDIEQVYEGLFLDSMTSFENFTEGLFIGFLTKRLQHSSHVMIPRVIFKSDRVARDVVYNDRRYVDWFPYEKTVKRAEAFFRNGYPFTSLDNADKLIIKELLYTRNAIAHKSKYSLKMFEQKVVSSIPLIARDRTPAGFLRSIFRSNPVQTRYERMVADIAFIARKLC